jgi:chemotaxis protein MotB
MILTEKTSHTFTLLFLFINSIDIMRHLTIGFVAILSFVFISCGPGKDLISCRATSDSLNSVVTHLSSQVSQLTVQVNQLDSMDTFNKNQISGLKQQNVRLTHEASDCNEVKEEIAKKMMELNTVLKAQGTSLHEVKKKAEEALAQFANAGIDVTYKHGLVYIEMQDQLLYKSGSAKLGKDGSQALSVVAQVLNDNPNLKIYVIGNTDSTKVSSGFTDNWSLSTERANTVVRVLRDMYQVNMGRVVSAGKGKYDPIADNSSEEGRAKNRRTDIILSPDMSQLWDLIDNQQ